MSPIDDVMIRAAHRADLDGLGELAGSRDRAEAAGAARGADAMSLDVDVDDEAAVSFYEGLGYVIVRPHQHRWRAVDPRTGAVTGEGTASTWIMRRHLRGAG
ncbi:hypothetical protein [Micromonospora sp. NPDC000442]|uniref:hypothetical protein n=1 Tax=Micromonospora sp. NPDC000442 TaxID=3364217 RepID=UPI0036A457EC